VRSSRCSARQGTSTTDVRWDDDHESVFYPSSDSTIQKAVPRKKRK
jgi:Domain of unknown function (DUF1918)